MDFVVAVLHLKAQSWTRHSLHADSFQAFLLPPWTSSSSFNSGYTSRSEGSQPRWWQPTVDTELVLNCGVLPQNHLTTTSWIPAQKSDKLPGRAISRKRQEQNAFTQDSSPFWIPNRACSGAHREKLGSQLVLLNLFKIYSCWFYKRTSRETVWCIN